MQLEALQSLALAVASARSPESVLREVVHGLGMTEGVALARVWLLREESGGPPYLELKASIGRSIADPQQTWTRTDGAHHRIPLHYGKVGYIAATSEPLLLQRGARDWLLQPSWAEEEGIQSFAGQPLSFRGQVLGVVVFFSRLKLDKQDLSWLRVFADHAAVAIANARAFEEIERLKELAERERDYLREAVRTALHPGEVVADSPPMRAVLEQVRHVALTDSPVMILGESGVGKELVASAVHAASRRRSGPLVKVNCASVPRELFESEFFGHVRGAFSGASRDRQGRFLLADGGTLFLDEVGEIPMELQGKLLRVLQESTFEPVGDDRTRKVDVRVVCATNRPLEADMEAGRFRRDLYYRLGVFPVHVPPLRERREDVLPMARAFLRAICTRLNIPPRTLSPADEAALLAYDFPGNVRELQNILERAVVLDPTSALDLRLSLGRSSIAPAAPPSVAPISHVAPAGPSRELDPAHLDEVIPEDKFRALERRNVQIALARCEGKVAGENGAAKLLGLHPSTLTYRMKQLGIERPRGGASS